MSYPPLPQYTNFVSLVSTIKSSMIGAILFLSNCSGFDYSLYGKFTMHLKLKKGKIPNVTFNGQGEKR